MRGGFQGGMRGGFGGGYDAMGGGGPGMMAGGSRQIYVSNVRMGLFDSVCDGTDCVISFPTLLAGKISRTFSVKLVSARAMPTARARCTDIWCSSHWHCRPC